MSPLPWRKKSDEPALDDLLDELQPSLDRGDEGDGAVRSNEEEELLDQYVSSESVAGGVIDTESGVDSPDDGSAPDLSLEIDPDEAEDASKSDDVTDDVMSIFEDEVEEDEDLAALSRGLDEVDATQLLVQARSVGQRLASRRGPG
jgi:hypothetical protein